MEPSKKAVRVAREPRSHLAGLIAAIGSAWTSRKIEKSWRHNIRLTPMAGQVEMHSRFTRDFELSKSRALYHHLRNQAR